MIFCSFVMAVSSRTPRLGAAHPDRSAPSLGSRLRLTTPPVRLNPNYFKREQHWPNRSTAYDIITQDHLLRMPSCTRAPTLIQRPASPRCGPRLHPAPL